MAPSVLITNSSIAEPARAILESRGIRAAFVPIRTPPDEVRDLIAREGFDAIISRTIKITAEAIAASPRLRIISKHGVGVDNIDVEAATARGVVVTAARAGNAQSVAEHVFAMMLCLAKRILPLDAGLRRGQWLKEGHAGGELAGKRLGIVGYGSIGRIVAPLARAFGMMVAVYDPYVAADAVPAGIRRHERLDVLLAEADFVTLHCPLTKDTRGIVGAAQLRRMKPTACLINCARGGIVDEAALAAALKDGAIAGAGIDCFEREPAPADSPLWAMPNVVVTPHAAGSTAEAFDRVAVQSVENVLAVLDGRPLDPACVVNPAVLAKRSA
jgi:D-3-phosphoglycerate dehydrogenase